MVARTTPVESRWSVNSSPNGSTAHGPATNEVAEPKLVGSEVTRSSASAASQTSPAHTIGLAHDCGPARSNIAASGKPTMTASGRPHSE